MTPSKMDKTKKSHILSTPLVKINVSIQANKIIAWRSSRVLISFAYRCVTRYERFTRNCWKRYISRCSNGWAEFWPEPMKFLLDWLRILSHRTVCLFCCCTCSLVLVRTSSRGISGQQLIMYFLYLKLDVLSCFLFACLFVWLVGCFSLL